MNEERDRRRACAGKRLKACLDEGRLRLVGAASPLRPRGRVVLLVDEVDAWPDHQQSAITTR